MNHKPLPFLLVGLMAVAVGSAWWWASGRGPTAETTVAPSISANSEERAESHGGAQAEVAQDTPSPGTVVGRAAQDPRHSVDPVIRGRVRLEDAMRNSSARVLGSEIMLDATSPKSLADWEAETLRLHSAAVDEDGGFSLEPGFSKPARVYVVQPHHRLTWAEVSDGQAPELVAESAPPVSVRVLGPETEETPSAATVFAVYSIRPEPGAAATAAERITLPCSYPAESTGSVLIARGGEEVSLWAVAGKHRSAMWQGTLADADEIVLDLNPTFVASGSLTGLEALDPPASGLHVSCFRSAANERRLLGSIEVTPQGLWRLADLPTDGVSPLIFRLAGAGVVSAEKTHAPVPAGSELQVEFELTQPRGLSVQLVDFEENPISAVSLVASWMSESRVFSSAFETGDDGYGVLFEAPAGDVWIDVEKEGYSGGRFGPYALREDGEWRILIPIGRAGRIAGRCVRSGEPVIDFTLRYWKDQPWNVREVRATGRQNGEFVIEAAPLGLVQLLASSPDCPGTPLHTVEVKPETEAWVEVELPSPGTAAGRVVDPDTGTPIPAATVQVLTAATAEDAWPWGDAHSTNSSGEFSGVPVSEPLTMLEISAPGYASVTRRAHARPGAVFDCGTVELPRSQELTVQLVDGNAEDYPLYTVSVDGAAAPERQPFDEGGRADFAGVSPGKRVATIVSPHGTTTYVASRLYTGAEWRIEVPLDTGRELTIRVRDKDGELPSPGMWAGVAFSGSSATETLAYTRLDEEGELVLTCVPEGSVVVDIVDAGFEQVGSASGVVPAEEALQLSVTLESETHRVRFLDASRQPLTSAEVIVNLDQTTISFGYSAVTDEEGIAVLRGFSPDTVEATVKLPGAIATGIPVDLRPGHDDPIEVVVDVSGELDITVLDVDLPLSGVWAQLKRRNGKTVVTSLSDSDGKVDFFPVSPGPYAVEVNVPGYWPSRVEVEARSDRPRYSVQVRRLSTIRFRVSRAGRPVHGASLDLVSREYGEPVAHWVSAGLARATSQGLTTDAGGVLVVYDVPHGTYSWSITEPGSAPAEGEVVALPRTLVDVPISVR